MINNRQNGRRRGRGGGPRTPNNAPSPGNRQENRSRGNAAQLHEKYKALARDTQLAGDRVQTETYLQYADHYFRVLNESRARFEEQRPRRDDFTSDEDEDQDQDEAMNADDGDQDEREERSRDDRSRDERPREERAREERPREERPREARDERPREERPAREPRYEREPRTSEPRARRPRAASNDRDESAGSADRYSAQRDDNDDAGEARISLDSLPPAIAAVDSAEAPRAPRRRTRRPRGDEDTEIAPAA